MLSVKYSLVGASKTVGAPVLGSPTYHFTLAAASKAVAAPVLTAATLTMIGPFTLTAASKAVAAPVLTTATLEELLWLAPEPLATLSPYLSVEPAFAASGFAIIVEEVFGVDHPEQILMIDLSTLGIDAPTPASLQVSAPVLTAPTLAIV